MSGFYRLDILAESDMLEDYIMLQCMMQSWFLQLDGFPNTKPYFRVYWVQFFCEDHFITGEAKGLK